MRKTDWQKAAPSVTPSPRGVPEDRAAYRQQVPMGAFVASEEQVQVPVHGEVETLHAAEPALRANPNLPHSPCGCAKRCLDLYFSPL